MVPTIARKEARYGNAANTPNSKRLPPSPLANRVSGAPAVAVTHTDPNTHASVIKRSERRSTRRSSALRSNFRDPKSKIESLTAVIHCAASPPPVIKYHVLLPTSLVQQDPRK